MIISIIIAFYNSFLEEFKMDKPSTNKPLLMARIILSFISLVLTGLFFITTLLAEQEASITEIISLYIYILYIIFLLGNFIIPWKIISVSKRLSNLYVLTLITSFIFFSLAQIINLYFSEDNRIWKSLTDNYLVYVILFTLVISLIGLFLITHKIYHKDQKKKNLKAEWNRLSSRNKNQI